MFKITALKLLTPKKRVNVYMNNTYAFSLERKLVDRIGLRVGQELSDDQVEEITRCDLAEKAIKSAFRYISYRLRSEKEIRERLRKHGFDNVIEEVIKRLKELSLVDDVAFARFWKENRVSFKPLSRRLLRQELKQKGIAEPIIAEVILDMDDNLSAIKAGRKRIRLLIKNEYPEFRHRLTTFLRWRGFNYETIACTVAFLWQEVQSSKAK